MVAYNFKTEFADLVERGEKRQTIRPPRKDNRHAKRGDKLQLYTGMRTKSCRKLRDAVCHDACGVLIERDKVFTFGPQEIHMGEDLENLAKNDGFENWAAMRDWFDAAYGLPFKGWMIRWLAPRRGNWMQTATGRMFWPIDPRPDDVCIEDIAHALSLICRYCGHVREFYSVAQHSVLVARHAPPEHRLWALLHDASEAYIADVPRPLKPSLTNYKAIERKVMDAVCDHFGLPREEPAEVKRIDDAILADEAAQLVAPAPQAWDLSEPPLGIEIEPWSPERARHEFMAEFNALVGD